ncbi:MAG: thymidine phosphorylase [Bacilli bacterium]|nr:thymidine phosphorylase [Bacilli bacterium]MDD4547612.1 thymidine phosphorylase [Bacilli bacterium]
MNIIDIITKKKNSLELSQEELEFAINGFVDGVVKDYQMSSLLMAITINGMSDEETINLTNIMLNSGEIIDLSMINNVVVDKHSTGGVGDKTTLVLAPLVASCGVAIAKMSGRGLGHTGGTIDKLEAIKNFQVNIDNDAFIKQVNEINLAVVSQKGNLVPADKLVYALRDVTGTTSSIPLIASSIMSKKLASGADKIVLDVKVGNGALLDNIEDAKKLATLMVKIGKQNNKETICVLTNMDEPLGRAIGNGLEVIESIKFLKGEAPEDLYTLTTSLAAIMVSIGKNQDIKTSLREVVENLENGKAYQKFLDMVKYQGGDINEIAVSSKVHSIRSSKTGFINKIDSLKIGNLVKQLGGGRVNKDDVIDLGVGFVLNKKVGDYVVENEELIKVYYGKGDITVNDILNCFEIDVVAVDKPPLIYEIIR